MSDPTPRPAEPKDPASMVAALKAIESGDVRTLAACLEAEPALLTARSEDLEWQPGKRPQLLHAVLVLADKAEQPLPVLEMVQLLLARGASLTATDPGPKGNTPLCLAAYFGLLDVVDALLDAGAPIDDGDLDEYGMSALEHCLNEGWAVPSARHLAERGASVSVTSLAGLGWVDKMRERAGELTGDPSRPVAAFLTACMCGQVAAASFCLDELRVDVNVSPPGEEFSGIGATGLHWAAASGSLPLVELLLARGGDPTAEDSVFGGRPAQWAEEHPEVVALLARHEG